MTSFTQFLKTQLANKTHNQQNKILWKGFDVIMAEAKNKNKDSDKAILKFKQSMHNHPPKKCTIVTPKYICDICNETLILDEINTKRVCETCGFTDTILLDNIHQRNDNKITYPTHYAYNRIDHLITRLKKKKFDSVVLNKIIKIFQHLLFDLVNEYKREKKTYVNYNFVISQILHLINATEYYHLYPEMKSQKRKELHLKIWKRVCDKNNLRFSNGPTFL